MQQLENKLEYFKFYADSNDIILYDLVIQKKFLKIDKLYNGLIYM